MKCGLLVQGGGPEVETHESTIQLDKHSIAYCLCLRELKQLRQRGVPNMFTPLSVPASHILYACISHCDLIMYAHASLGENCAHAYAHMQLFSYGLSNI